jgi:hypothetical protein
MSKDIYFKNQSIFCKQNNLPLFASTSCSHMYNWVTGDKYGNLQSFGEMLVEKYGDEEAFIISAGTHVISCPSCSKSWCD